MQTEGLGFDRVVLLDVQGLFGGCDLWLAADGAAWGRTVGPPVGGEAILPERRFRFTVPPADLAELGGLLTRHDVASLRTPNRYGVPDEARPALCVQSGPHVHAVGKWANDVHAEFDAIYGLLVRLVRQGAEAAPAAGSDWDGQAPPGFPDRRTLLALAEPVLDE